MTTETRHGCRDEDSWTVCILEKEREREKESRREGERAREIEVTEYCRVSTPKSWVG